MRTILLLLFTYVFFATTDRSLVVASKLDPIKFTLSTTTTHVQLNQEFEIIVKAEYQNVSPGFAFVLKGANFFRIKLIMPEGFVKTGGDYYDYVEAELTPARPKVYFKVKGKFISINKKATFELLRSSRYADSNSTFAVVSKLEFNAETQNIQTDLPSSARTVAGAPGFVLCMTMAELRSGFAPDTITTVVITDALRAGLFLYDPMDSTSADNSALILCDGARRFKRLFDGAVNVQWWGAVGDGITSDRSAIQSAINYVSAKGGGTVYVPKGIYTIDASINIPSKIHLKGDGDYTEIRCTGTDVYPAVKNVDFINGNSDITVSNLTINGNRVERGVSEDAGSHGIRIQANDVNHCARIRIEHVWVKNMPCAGMMLFNVKDVIVSNNKVSDTMRDGISCWLNSENISYANNLMWDVRDDCYGINSEVTGHSGTVAKNITISGGQLSHAADSHYGSAIRIAGAWDVTVTGVAVSNIQGHGILVEGSFLNNNPSKRVTVSACTINITGFNVAAGGHGLAVSNVIGCNITGNVIQKYQVNGVNISTFGREISVTDNTILDGIDVNGVGVNIDGESNLISGNVVIQTKSYGIKVNSQDNAIVANKLKECSTAAPGNAYILVSANVNFNNIASNIIRRSNTSNGTYGIRIATGTSSGNQITGNHIRGFNTGNAISSSGSGLNPVSNNLEIP